MKLLAIPNGWVKAGESGSCLILKKIDDAPPCVRQIWDPKTGLAPHSYDLKINQPSIKPQLPEERKTK